MLLIWSFPRRHFNPPSPCGEGLILAKGRFRRGWISIHPPRVGRDEYNSSLDSVTKISIHPPRVGRDSKSSQKFFVNFCARR